jgi:pimeloyl-ACP methyl ester carboxylesterase
MTRRVNALNASSFLGRAIVAVALVGVLGQATRAQDVPVVFVHGVFSTGDGWRQTAARLATRLQIEPHVVDLDSRDYLERQTSQLHALKGGLPTHSIAIGHSQGGLLAREWTRTKSLRGILTVGTPHWGAPLSRNALDVLHFNHVLYSMIGLASSWGAGTEVAWIASALQSYFTTGLQLSAGVVQRLLATVAIAGYVPVAPQLVPGSAFLLNLNSGGNLAREAIEVPRRVGLQYIADQYWRAGVGVGLAPDHREWVWAAMVVLPPTFEFAAAWVDAHYPTAFGLSTQLRNISGFILELDPMWC